MYWESTASNLIQLYHELRTEFFIKTDVEYRKHWSPVYYKLLILCPILHTLTYFIK